MNEIANEIAEELGYKGFDGTWGDEHLVGGKSGDCYFNSTTLVLFRMIVAARAEIRRLKAPREQIQKPVNVATTWGSLAGPSFGTAMRSC